MEQYLKDLLARARVFDLGMPYFTGMPHHPNQPPFAYTLTKKHGDITLTEEKVSFCNDLFVMGGHTGTHLDAKAHVACRSLVCDNVDITDLQGYQDGLHVMGIETTPPIVKRGVLLDIPRSVGLEVLPHDFGIGKDEMDRRGRCGPREDGMDQVLGRPPEIRLRREGGAGRDRERRTLSRGKEGCLYRFRHDSLRQGPSPPSAMPCDPPYAKRNSDHGNA
jgi:hypothetical protein